MRDVTIITEDKVGLLADISYILGKAKINIESISVTSVGGKAVITILVKSPERAEDVLKKNGFKVSSGNILFVKLDDKPGALSQIAKTLADNKINVENLNLVSKDGKSTVVGITVDRPRKAKTILEKYLVENVES
jgi:hypothetical protein